MAEGVYLASAPRRLPDIETSKQNGITIFYAFCCDRMTN